MVNPFIIAAGIGLGVAIIFTIVEDFFVKDDDQNEYQFAASYYGFRNCSYDYICFY